MFILCELARVHGTQWERVTSAFWKPRHRRADQWTELCICKYAYVWYHRKCQGFPFFSWYFGIHSIRNRAHLGDHGWNRMDVRKKSAVQSCWVWGCCFQTAAQRSWHIKSGRLPLKIGLRHRMARFNKMGGTEFHRLCFWAKCTRWAYRLYFPCLHD